MRDANLHSRDALLLFLGPIAATVWADVPAHGEGPFAIPTFHCLGIYWSPPGGAAGKDVQVRYRRQGAAEWNDGAADALQPHSRDRP